MLIRSHHIVLPPAAPVADRLGLHIGAVQPLILSMQHECVLVRRQVLAHVQQTCTRYAMSGSSFHHVNWLGSTERVDLRPAGPR